MSEPMTLHLLPEDISAEEVLTYMPRGSFRVSFDGPHKRASYNDILGIDSDLAGKATLHLGRRSLYDALPEYLFHPVNRFDGLPRQAREEAFAEECHKQETEIWNARHFFQPFDLLLMTTRMQIKDHVEKYASENKAIVEMLADELDEGQKRNRFIRQALTFLPFCRKIRGNKFLLTQMLRKIFIEESLVLKKTNETVCCTDPEPRYDGVTGCCLSDMYIDNSHEEEVITYTIHYWSDNDCNGEFPVFLKEIDDFRQFVQDYFISVEEVLLFDISHEEPPLRLSDTILYNYLNYNTYL